MEVDCRRQCLGHARRGYRIHPACSLGLSAADATAKPESWTFPSEPAPPIASGWPATPRINPPRITGGTPGRPFVFRIPATGDAPLTFAARNLPQGLVLDPKTGVITGAIAREGRSEVELTVTNARGRATRTLTIVGGKDALALTPPLGWNSWNVWGRSVDEAKVRAAADALESSGLAAASGNVDQCKADRCLSKGD